MGLLPMLCIITLWTSRCLGLSQTCRSDQWQCDNGECIPASWRCRGVGRCLDGSDQMYCACPEFACRDGSRCVTFSLVCDNKPQCDDGSDESECVTGSGCLPGHWQCRSKRCVPPAFMCDGKNDCGDSSDEENCDFKFAYATLTSVYILEFKRQDIVKTLVLTTDEGILSFDIDWQWNWLFWANSTGSVKGTHMHQLDQVLFIPTPSPACVIKVDSRSGSIYWLSCNRRILAMTALQASGVWTTKSLYHAVNEVHDLYIDWQRGNLYWLEDKQVFRMGVSGGNAKMIVNIPGNIGQLALDRKSNRFLWNDNGLKAVSLLKNKYLTVRWWNVTGLVMAAEAPYLVSLVDDVIMLWNLRLGRHVSAVTVKSSVVGIAVYSSVDGDVNTPPQYTALGVPIQVTFAPEVHQNIAVGEVLPTWVTSCKSPSVPCERYPLCISPSQLCDGTLDCPDGSDEESCQMCANPDDFLCKDRLACIDGALLCDGRAQCYDGSDEVSCPMAVVRVLRAEPLKCRWGWTPCRDGRQCVMYIHLCDGDADCEDGSDEDECVVQCLEEEFQCAHGKKCIDRKLVCDGTPHCQDQSDEVDCWTKTRECSHRCDDTRCIPESFLCDGERDCVDGTDELGCAFVSAELPPTCKTPSVLCRGTTLCVSQSQLCDGKMDCPDGSDEKSCLEACNDPADFLCKDKRGCIKKTLVCDGHFQCYDGSDEVGCTTEVVSVLKPKPVKCAWGSTLCRDGSECILFHHVCDGSVDCKDGSDEDRCAVQCTAGEFQCAHGKKCIDRKLVCDGTPHCQDQSDEVDCRTKSRECSHRCDNETRCVPESFLCDGERDCLDGTDELGCVPATTVAPRRCKSPSVLCPGTTLCVSQSQLCDGKMDCPDGSDENSCLEACNDPADFLCKDRRACIKKTLVCDGHFQCYDGSDEVGCTTEVVSIIKDAKEKLVTCRLGFTLCADGSGCVLYSHLCDGDVDCKDGSDENDCPIQCAAGQFQCKDGKCVQLSEVCDGTPQCRDWSDEVDCGKGTVVCKHRCDNNARCVPESSLCDGRGDCLDGTDELDCVSMLVPAATVSPPSCKSPSILCPGTSLCVSQSQLCDGKMDCPDGSDEKSCLEACNDPADFLCKDKRACIKKTLVCDGHFQCYDGSDEVGCTTEVVSVLKPKPVKCAWGSTLCRDGSECILFHHVCDGSVDCKDGSDEDRCAVQCTAGEFQCAHGKKCIDRKLVCDGTPHCQDQSDEVDCRTKSRECSHRCDNETRCIPESFLCDGERDCLDGTDELGCAPATTVAPRRCKSPSVLCPGTTLCVSQSQLCDGKMDCPDGSDENSCLEACNDPADFLCKDKRTCIKKTLLCDGHAQCYDGSDEVSCPAEVGGFPEAKLLKCRLGFVLCRDGSECILLSHVCDGGADCKDGSDEDQCAVKCPAGQFLCNDQKKCISIKQVCDGTPHCQDQSDEVDCLTKSKSCTHRCDDARCVPESFRCDGKKDCLDGTDELGCASATAVAPPSCKSPSVLCPGTSLCVSQSQLCDGKMDCPDGSDEKSCLEACNDPADFLCKDRRACIKKTLVCDGHFQCYDGSDEVGCTTEVVSVLKPKPMKCAWGSTLCRDGSECILFHHVCDGSVDCKDGSDEDRCAVQCTAGEFQCAHGKKCIDRKLVCDGTPHCQDQSDEVDCRTKSRECSHRCDNETRCVPESFLCDGERDCLDGTDELGCAPATTVAPLSCKSPSVLCPGTTLCVSQSQLCDRKMDCPDGSDESSCLEACNDPADFLCKDRRACIKKTLVCDGHFQCYDGSDEVGCTTEVVDVLKPKPVKCAWGSTLCRDGSECILFSHLCDGHMDCRDGSDEDDCAVQCITGQFQCAHGKKCIDRKLVCDGTPHCQDQSDEVDCVQASDCAYLCDDKTRCIPESFVCDGEQDCVDGTDERDCVVAECSREEFRCRSGQCIAQGLRCDGYAECHDHSDEEGCAKPPHCPSQHQCPNSHECLFEEWFCDGDKDCLDGADEMNCKVYTPKCGEFQWTCASKSQCLPKSWRCDGTTDCDDGSDEFGCGQKKCPPHKYQCRSGECMDLALLCNGINNCLDGSDEGKECLSNVCSSSSILRCADLCYNTPQGPRCSCRQGFRLQLDGVSCVDVDECEGVSSPVCSHSCLNTLGSYLCVCHPGYVLEPDRHSCKSTDEPGLLVAVQNYLLFVGLRSDRQSIFYSGKTPVFSMDYDWPERRIFWVGLKELSIRWMSMDQKSEGFLVKGVKPDHIAIDWVGRNLYWTDNAAGQILVVQLNMNAKNQEHTVVLDEDLQQLRALVLLPKKGLMFWSEFGSAPQIERSGMDGSERKIVVNDLGWPGSLAMDVLDDRLYWTDEKLRCIGSAMLDGRNIKLLQLTETLSPFSVGVFNDMMVWSDNKRKSVQSANKVTGKSRRVVYKQRGQLFGLKVIHALHQMNVPNPCLSQDCSHLCLLGPGPKAVCRCPLGLLLASDRTTCSAPVDSAFLMLLSPTTVTQVPLQGMQMHLQQSEWPEHRALLLPDVSQATLMDLVLEDQILYLAEASSPTVRTFQLTGERLMLGSTVLRLPVGDTVTALAVDWVSLNLYWSSSQQSHIHVTSARGHYTLVLVENLKTPTGIALHPPAGRLCFSDLGLPGSRDQPQLKCGFMDGRNISVVWAKAVLPSSLTFSNQGTEVYWADIGLGIISSIQMDGTGYKEYKTGHGVIVSFASSENILFWLSFNDTTKLWYSDGLQPKRVWFDVKTSIVSLKAYSRLSQKGTNTCAVQNGGCSQLCLPFPAGRTCRCTHDTIDCRPKGVCQPGTEPCRDGRKCVSAVKFCDGVPDCMDRSDEEGCSNASTSTHPRISKPFETNAAPTSQSGSSLLQGQDLSSCDAERCHGHGRCVVMGGETSCDCLKGYSGPFCQDRVSGSRRALLILGIIVLLIGTIVLVFLFVRRRYRGLLISPVRATWLERFRGGEGSSEKETLMARMEARMGYSQRFSNRMFDPEDLSISD